MGFSDFLKSDTGQGLMSKIGGSSEGGQQRQQGPSYDTPIGASEGVSRPADNVDHDNNGFKNVVKTVASFWFGGAAGAMGKGGAAASTAGKAGAASGAASGASGAAASGASSGAMSNAVQQGVGLGLNGGRQQQQQPSSSYSDIANQYQDQPWMQNWGRYG